MKIKAVIFDMDGVLTNSMNYHIASWKQAFNLFNIFPTSKEIALMEGMSYKETINTLSKKYSIKLTKAKREKIYAKKREILNEIFKLKIYPKVLELLGLLKNNNIRLALVTGANKEFATKIIEDNFYKFFKIVITGTDVKQGKPNPEPYLTSLKKLRLKPEEVIVIENAPLGIQSSKNANLKTFAITTTLKKRHLKQADKIFSSHKKLLKYFKKFFSNQNP